MYNYMTHIPPMPKYYDPWLNGAASYFDGTYYLNGLIVTIISSLSTVSVEYADGNSDNLYFQGDDSDELIKNMCWRWENACETPDDCVNFVISHFV